MHIGAGKSLQSSAYGLALGFLMLLSAVIMARDLTRPVYGLHSWAQAHTAWLARAHVNYGLAYTKGLYTWAVGNPPPAHPRRYLDHPQLPALLNAGAMLVVGVESWAPRAAALIIMIACIPLMLELLRRLFGEGTAILATLLFILFPVTGYFFDRGAWMVPVYLGAWWCYLSLIGAFGDEARPKARWSWGLGACLFLMIQLGWHGVFYALAIGIHYVVRCVRRRKWPRRNLLLVLLACPLASLVTVFSILLAGRGWDYGQLIALYKWRATLGGAPERTLGAWFGRILEFAQTNFTLPALLMVGVFLALSAVGRFSAWRAGSESDVADRSRRKFHFAWLFFAPGLFYVLAFREAMWVHQFQHRHFSLFVAIAAALGIMGLRDLLIARHRLLADGAMVLAVTAVLGYGMSGLNAYYAIEHQPPARIALFESLRNRISPDQVLLSYESYVVSEHPAKGSFYRPEIAWALDREIVVARSLAKLEEYAATGKARYFLIYSTGAPLLRELRRKYSYEYLQGNRGGDGKLAMPTYHLFDLQERRSG